MTNPAASQAPSNAPVKRIGVHEGHNAAVAVVEDGTLTFGIQEERISRYKNQGDFPSDAFAMAVERTELTDTATIAYEGRNIVKSPWLREDIKAGYELSRRSIAAKIRSGVRHHPIVSERVNLRKQEALASELAAVTGTQTIIERVEHHTCHAAAAYFGWGVMDEKVLIITCDGAGDEICASVSVGHQGKIERLATVHKDDSIGRLYANVTYAMGMVPLEHEYKLMGMAPYAEHSSDARSFADELHAMFEHTQNGLSWRRRPGVPPQPYAYAFVRDLLEKRRFDHVCAGLQTFTEEFLVKWIETCIAYTGVPNVALGGGVFMNVKANQKVLESDAVERCFVMPSCGDETNAIGSAWYRYHAETGVVPERLTHMYLGDEYTDDEIEAAIGAYAFDHKIKVTEPNDVEEEVAAILSQRNVVARFKGPMEFGARSLGNRAILANPADPDAVRHINRMIKNRDFWMPFTPSVLPDRSDDYFRKTKDMEAPYMIMTFTSHEHVRSRIPAVIHPADNTARPQEVYQSWNSDYHRLISAFSDLTNEGIVLNTSFNLHGEPVVRTPADALRVFDLSGLNYLAIGSYILRKDNA